MGMPVGVIVFVMMIVIMVVVVSKTHNGIRSESDVFFNCQSRSL